MANVDTIKREKLDLDLIKTQKEDDLFYFVQSDTLKSERITAPRYSYWKSVFRIFFKKKINWIILGFLALLLFMSFIFPLIFPYNEMENVNDTFMQSKDPIEAMKYYGYSIKWIFGTGPFANSTFYGVWASARTSLALGIICALINMTIGILLGAVWGYSKFLDAIFNVIYNIVANVPYILLISILVYVIGSGFAQFVFALTITGWLGIAYFFRTQVLIIRDREYNLASKCLGTNIFRVVRSNVLPYLVSVIVTIMATEIPSYIGMEVYLTYIGIGLSSEVPSLGHMIGIAQGTWTVNPWPFWAPVAISAMLTISLYFVGQNLADASDPRSHMN